jgi:CRISPR-associated protein Csb2
MPLVLEIEHLLGVSFAAISPADTMPDWPPQPDRVFSALVSAWAGRNKRTAERQALEWLESLSPPEIAASGGFPRSTAIVFVPPNDPESGRVAERTVMPDYRRRQPRRFPAYRPEDATIRLVWPDVEVDGQRLATLNALAADVPYVGHSASLTRCRFRTDGVPPQRAQVQRRVYKGRLSELERTYDAGRRPDAGEIVITEPGADRPCKRSIFSNRWVVLEAVSETPDIPDIRAAALVSKALRCALMSGYKAIGHEARIPDTVSGHTPDGSPLADPHLAITPLAFLGTQYADARVYGFALIPPGEGELLDSAEFQSALRQIAKWNAEYGWRELNLVGDGLDLTLTPSRTRPLHTLDPAPYVAAAKTWATCTPIVLDRHLKAKSNAARDQEVRELIVHACANIGLPPPARAVLRGGDGQRGEFLVAAVKHSAIEGAPSAYPSGNAPRWTGWRLPKSLASRQLTHAVLQFEEPVRGPVILGAGRFVGLGLCREVDSIRGGNHVRN